jgi:mRNA-degrading endonuclease RelE of RelBE toxin-antitoxin system
MTGIFRVHIGKSFVLTYEILEEKRTVKLIDYNHHDKVYY